MDLGPTFSTLDALVVLGVLVGTTVLGERLAGRQGSLSDFFLGGRRLPWWAVSASIIATEISAVTYVSLPSVVYREGGNQVCPVAFGAAPSRRRYLDVDLEGVYRRAEDLVDGREVRLIHGPS